MSIFHRYASLLFLLIVSAEGYCSNAQNNDQTYLKENRIKYISSVINAFNITDLQTLENTYRYIHVIDRNNCQSNLSGLRLECMLNYAEENCKSLRNRKAASACQYYSDIIVVNKLSERLFINKSERYRMAKNNQDGDIRNAITSRLQQKYAQIVTQFALSEKSNCDRDDKRCLATGLDQFCLDYTNKESLSWQYCTSAVLWFIGITKRGTSYSDASKTN